MQCVTSAACLSGLFICSGALAQTPSPEVRKFIKFDQPLIALTKVRVIDGTGAPAQENRTIVLRNGRIAAVTDAATAPPAGAHMIALDGRTVMPGLVGMHNHLMYTASINHDEDGKVPPPASSSPRSPSARRACTWRPA